MPSANPRYRNWKAREHIRRKVKQRVLAGERCGICGKPIDLSLPQTWTDPKDGKVKRAPWSFEVDEIVPVSCGGDPIDEGNVQPAHRACNAWKGNGKRHRADTIEPREGSTSREW